MTEIRWFDQREAFTRAAFDTQAAIKEKDLAVVSARRIDGRCTACGHNSAFEVYHGGLGEPCNLRERLRCIRCKLTMRQRLILLAMQEVIGLPRDQQQGLLMEATTRLYRAAHARWPWLLGSEYLGDAHIGGAYYWWSTHWWRWRRNRHESITSLSFARDTLDLLAHSDVLEHVYGTQAALSESARVLRHGGTMIFTVPFFVDRDQSTLRGRPAKEGGIEHLEPPEFHGDGLRRGGIYTFHNFGWNLLEGLIAAGFSRAEIGFCHNPQEGFCASDPTNNHAWCTMPIVFRATK